ncbi:hypothetical protein BCR34DRAFT_144238 [Clohesyomyces aquaticus]|uniref:Uncharacterized protein n=1 Tax=Clohesyomyces aquaticus TaxID=1231657 RepID=A0A1Y2A0K6_9PLEO|nr:hypothetical protein BCR34DRAFT_144238 [Clohesyomyces aquaticus]
MGKSHVANLDGTARNTLHSNKVGLASSNCPIHIRRLDRNQEQRVIGEAVIGGRGWGYLQFLYFSCSVLIRLSNYVFGLQLHVYRPMSRHFGARSFKVHTLISFVLYTEPRVKHPKKSCLRHLFCVVPMRRIILPIPESSLFIYLNDRCRRNQNHNASFLLRFKESVIQMIDGLLPAASAVGPDPKTDTMKSINRLEYATSPCRHKSRCYLTADCRPLKYPGGHSYSTFDLLG